MPLGGVNCLLGVEIENCKYSLYVQIGNGRSFAGILFRKMSFSADCAQFDSI
jgi:hypothetical protein